MKYPHLFRSPDRRHRPAFEGGEPATETGRGGTAVGPRGPNATLGLAGGLTAASALHVDCHHQCPWHVLEQSKCV